MRAPRLAALAVLLSTATAAHAVITVLTPLSQIVQSDTYIFVAKADKLDPDNKDRPTATFTVTKKLKGEPPFDRLPVNMTGDDEGKKAGDTKTIFDRLDTSRELVFFVLKQGKAYNAKVFVEGSWFSVYGTLDADGKTVRWAFLHGEPFLRRTFKGTSAELIKTVEDALAKKGKPPEPDEKEKPGYGPPVAKEKKCGDEPLLSRGSRPWLRPVAPPGLKSQSFAVAERSSSPGGAADRSQGREPLEPATPEPTSGPLFAVIPSFVLVGPLALVAALFPGVFARLAVGMKRWRAFLVVASLNSTLALVYFAFTTYLPDWTKAGGRAFAPQTVALLFTLVAVAGLVWAGRRYRRMAAAEPDVTGTPGKAELYTLAGLTAFAAVCTLLTAWFAGWNSTVSLPMREFTFIGIALAVATTYAAYRMLTKASDLAPGGGEPPVRLSASGESVGLAALALCGFGTFLLSSGWAAKVPVQAGDAEGAFGPRLVGDPTVIEVYELEGDKKEPVPGRVLSNLTLDDDRLYFGADLGANRGWLLGVHRASGRVEWSFAPPGLRPVFCTPTVANGRVYCGEGLHEHDNCRLFCVNVKDETAAWEPPFKAAKGHTEGQPAVVGGKVFFPAGDDGFICCDAKTGKELWRYTGDGAKDVHIDTPPVVADGVVFAGSGLFNYVAVALDANTGKPKWRTDLKLRAFGQPLALGGKVFYGVGTGDMSSDIRKYDEEGDEREKEAAGAVCCLDAATGKEEWRYALPKSVHAGLAGDAFSIYAGCRDGSVYALDRKSGKLRWKAGIGSAVTSRPAVATEGGFPVAVYAVSTEGRVFCLNPQTGAVVWSRDALPGHGWRNDPTGNAVLCAPLVVRTETPTGSKRTIYIGAMTHDPAQNPPRRVAIFKFEDVIGE